MTGSESPSARSTLGGMVFLRTGGASSAQQLIPQLPRGLQALLTVPVKSVVRSLPQPVGFCITSPRAP